MLSTLSRVLAATLFAALVATRAIGADVVISQIYGGGGNVGAAWRQDFIEIVNRGAVPVSVAGWSLQYASVTGINWRKIDLPAAVLQPGQYLLVAGAAGEAGASLPAADTVGAINLAAGGGKLALLAIDRLIPAGTRCPSGAVDFVGYGSADCFEGAAAAPAHANSTALLRAGDGCVDRDANALDFGVAQPLPRGSRAPFAACGAQLAVRIRDIQGRAHLSPLASRAVARVPGIVTARRADGFWMQDLEPDDDVATSEGIFVQSTQPVAIGDWVEVDGIVAEVRLGAPTNLTLTRIVAPTLRVLSSGNPLPPAVVIGAAGRVPPGKVVDDDASGDVETSGSFDPHTDGIDFFESLEGMRVEVRDAVAIGPTGAFGEIAIVGDRGRHASVRANNGALLVAPDDFNPERLLLDNALVGAMPVVDSGARLGTVRGIVDYSGGMYRILVTERLVSARGPARPEQTRSQSVDELAIATFNVQNLGPSSPPGKHARVAAAIVANLRAPDVLVLVEMQDDSGELDDGTTAARRNFADLVFSILAAGGPQYDFRQIDPLDRTDGGVPGGNIRLGLLFNPARVRFVDRRGGTATAPVVVLAGASGPQLSLSPGRVEPANAAFADSRKPLAAELVFNGHTVFVVANHFNSKGGDAPLFGREQPPAAASAAKRAEQARALARFVDSIRALDARAHVVVAGDLNDFEFSAPLAILRSTGLVNLVDRLEPADRYTYLHAGNAQVLDHILVSPGLAERADFDIVHLNADFAGAVSDHDPAVVRLHLPTAGASAAARSAPAPRRSDTRRR